MRAVLAEMAHRVLRRLPAARNVYAQRDALAVTVAERDAAIADREARLSAAEAALRALPPPQPAPPPAPRDRFAEMLAASGVGAPAGVLLRLGTAGPLGDAGDPLLLPHDDVMFPVILRDRVWQAEELDFIRRHVDAAARYTLIDVGANVGLFSRQAKRAIGAIERLVCIEADPGNFAALCHNLAHLPRAGCALHNIALADRDGTMTWYRDNANFGNYSLNADAMRGQSFTTISVAAVETGAFLSDATLVADGTRVIWKSDTQGFDEAILARVPTALWERVDLAILELWRIDKPAFDREAFRARLAAFPNLSIGIGHRATVDEVMAYLAGGDYGFADLYLWR